MPERQRDFLSDLFQALAERSRKLLRPEQSGNVIATLEELAEALLSTRGEASGVSLAGTLVELWRGIEQENRRNWFLHLARNLGPDVGALNRAVSLWQENPSPAHASGLHTAAEPRRQELFRRINMAPAGTATLVEMRAALLKEVKAHPELAAVDADFEHLFTSWFNRGFLVLRRIDWSSSADVLEKIIQYEAVHEIRGWDDLKGRLKPADRRCFAFFHPQMPDEPLVFVEVALTRGIPAHIAPLISPERQPISEAEADTAVFYSITNTQAGLRGVSFGNFLIKQVVEELLHELPQLKCFVTLSPVPGFAAWLSAQRETETGKPIVPQLLELLSQENWHAEHQTLSLVRPMLEEAAALYLTGAKASNGKPADPVARFHLNNGAVLDRINFIGDTSAKGLRESHGIMVNYRYHLDAIERNHEAYANANQVVASPQVHKMLGREEQGSTARNWQSLLPQRNVKKA
jgi:malonyl-CoA decarboxylase